MDQVPTSSGDGPVFEWSGTGMETPVIELKGNRALRECAKHKALSRPEDGIEVGNNKWICGLCWRGLKSNAKRK